MIIVYFNDALRAPSIEVFKAWFVNMDIIVITIEVHQFVPYVLNSHDLFFDKQLPRSWFLRKFLKKMVNKWWDHEKKIVKWNKKL